MIMMTGTSVVFLLFGSGEVQPWDKTEQYSLSKRGIEKIGTSTDEQENKKQTKTVEEGKLSNE